MWHKVIVSFRYVSNKVVMKMNETHRPLGIIQAFDLGKSEPEEEIEQAFQTFHYYDISI